MPGLTIISSLRWPDPQALWVQLSLSGHCPSPKAEQCFLDHWHHAFWVRTMRREHRPSGQW